MRTKENEWTRKQKYEIWNISSLCNGLSLERSSCVNTRRIQVLGFEVFLKDANENHILRLNKALFLRERVQGRSRF